MASQKRTSLGSYQPMPVITEEDTAELFRRDIDTTLGTETNRAQRNAFAEDGLRLHRHRLAGNAFYQEEYARRKNTPPTMIHPAFRNNNTHLYDISQALPELSPHMDSIRRSSLDMQQVSPLHAHGSRNTTMSPFINAGLVERVPSPPLKLAPSPQASHVPTLRNTYDERATDASQREADDFITVTRYSPRTTAHHSQQSNGSNRQKVPAPPKRSLLDRFRVSNRRDAVPLQPLPSMDMADGSPNMPAKARAVLVAPPPGHPVTQSLSKSKSFWSRRKAPDKEYTEDHTPVSSLKAPPHAANLVFRRDELPGYTRSHSLGYVDDSVPPTPPSKDTPPDEKARHEASDAMIIPPAESTPTRKNGFLSLTDRISPNRFGGYGKRSTPKLVTQASTHSLRASVVPNAMDGRAFSDTKVRIDGLGLEGFSLPEENLQNTAAYSPSMYSPDMVESSGTFRSIAEHGRERSKSTSDTGISDMGDIPFIYPELARDPSMSAFMTPDRIKIEPNPDSPMHRSFSEHPHQDEMPTPRRGGLEVIIDEVDDMLQGGEPSPSGSSLFAIPLGHASAQVSPLHFQHATFENPDQQEPTSDYQPIMVNSDGRQILPATTYNALDVQQHSKHSLNHDSGLSRVDSARTSDKKSTAMMPGLEYDRGVDVDPQKMLVQQTTTSKQPRSSPSISRKENLRVVNRSPTVIPYAAGLGAVDVMGRGDSNVKDLIASYQQSDIGHRLSYLEESFKQQDAIAEKRRLEQDAIADKERSEQDSKAERKRLEQEALFDQRIASLEVERFSRQPSPANCYESAFALSRQSSLRNSLSPSHIVSDRKNSRRPPSLTLTPSPKNHPAAKRISTGDANDFYQSQLKDTPVMNRGNIDTAAAERMERASSSSSDTLRLEAANDGPQVPTLEQQQDEKIRQLQWTVDRQNEWIHATVAQMHAMELKYEKRNSAGK